MKTSGKILQKADEEIMREIAVSKITSTVKELFIEANYNIGVLGIGPAWLGGRGTALAVNIDYCPANIASLPVVVNVCCHAARHASAIT